MESRIFDQSRISLLLYIPLLFAVETTAKNNAGLSHRKCGTFSLAQPQPQFFSPSKMKTLSSCLSVHQASHFTSESVTDWDPLSFWMANTWLGGKGQSDIFTSFCIEFSSFPQNLFNFFSDWIYKKKQLRFILMFFSHSDKESNSPAGWRTSCVGDESGGWPVSVGWRSIWHVVTLPPSAWSGWLAPVWQVPAEPHSLQPVPPADWARPASQTENITCGHVTTRHKLPTIISNVRKRTNNSHLVTTN